MIRKNKTAVFIVGLALTLFILYSKEEQQIEENYRQFVKYSNDNSDTYHEDFDSTYFYNGCKANTFKSKHICNGK
jgi:hypothetical protein